MILDFKVEQYKNDYCYSPSSSSGVQITYSLLSKMMPSAKLKPYIVGFVLALFTTMPATITATKRQEYNHTYPPEYLNASQSHRISSQYLVNVFDHLVDKDRALLSWTWTIKTDEYLRLNISFLSFNTMPTYTVVEIGDGPVDDSAVYGVSYTSFARFTGVNPDDVISLSNSAWIKFTVLNDPSFTFEIDIHPLRQIEIQVDVESPVVIQSPGYPSNYKNNSYRLWNVRSPESFIISVIVEDFDLENPSEMVDNVHIGDTTDTFVNHGNVNGSWVRWRGRKPDDDFLGVFHYCSRGPSIAILFTTNWKDEGRGFSLRLEAHPDPSFTPKAPQSSTGIVINSTSSFWSSTAITKTKEVELTRSTFSALSMATYADSKQMCLECALVWKALFLSTICILAVVSVSFGLACYFQHHRIQIRIRSDTDSDDERPLTNMAISFKRMSAVSTVRQDEDDGSTPPFEPDPAHYINGSYVTRVEPCENQENFYYNVTDDFDFGCSSSVDRVGCCSGHGNTNGEGSDVLNHIYE